MTFPNSRERERLSREPPGRSFVDPVTNVTLLSPVQLDFHLVHLLAGRFPLEALPSFLHEATHHWCLFNPVGVALTLLNLRARRRAVAVGDPEVAAGIDTLDVVDDYVRYDAIVRVHSPLAEGLACFAEFDSLPGSSSVASQILHTLATNFTEIGRDGDVWDELRRTLIWARSGRRFVDRKTDVLLQGMGPQTAGYLAGYLTIKNLWRVAWSLEDRMEDTDLFLNFTASYFYADLGLVAHLLDPQTSDYGAVTQIVNYHGARLAGFRDALTPDALDALEGQQNRPLVDDLVEGDLGASLDSLTNLGVEPSLWSLGRERLLAMMEELRQEADADPQWYPLAPIANSHLWTIAQRELLCIGTLPVEVDVRADGHAHVSRRGYRGGEPLMVGPAPDQELWGSSGTGTITLFLNPWPWGRYMASVASLADRPVLTAFTREPHQVVKEQFEHYVRDAAVSQELGLLMARHLEDTLRADGDAQIELPVLRRSMDEWMQATYGRRALIALPDENVPRALEQMRNHGLFAVLDRRVPLVRALAWISLNWRLYDAESLAVAFAEVEPWHWAGHDLWPVVEAIRALTAERLGEELVWVNDGEVICII